MQRDDDLIRDILLKVEATPADQEAGSVHLDGYDERTVNRHIQLLSDEGYVDATIIDSATGGIAYGASVHRITWAGHEFLANARNESFWAKAKEIVGRAGGSTSIHVLSGVLEKVASRELLGA